MLCVYVRAAAGEEMLHDTLFQMNLEIEIEP